MLPFRPRIRQHLSQPGTRHGPTARRLENRKARRLMPAGQLWYMGTTNTGGTNTGRDR